MRITIPMVIYEYLGTIYSYIKKSNGINQLQVYKINELNKKSIILLFIYLLQIKKKLVTFLRQFKEWDS